MARQCEVCGKKPLNGHKVSHSNRKTNRRWIPNLQTIRLPINNIEQKVRLCTGCLRTYINKGHLKKTLTA